MTRRAYLIELILEVPEGMDEMQLDEDVSNVVDASSAREAIATGLDYANSYEPNHPQVEVLNFYMVEAGAEPRLTDGDDGMWPEIN